MKAKLIMAIGLISLTTTLNAKSQGGLYKTASDFRNNKMEFQTDCKKGKFKIHTHDFLVNGNSFTINCDKKKSKLQKSEVYGYRNCEGNSYRFYANESYEIAETTGIYIYEQKHLEQLSKKITEVKDYYFSATAESKILPLTKQNLAAELGANDRFAELLELGNADITAYDNLHRMFLVNYLYLKSIEK